MLLIKQYDPIFKRTLPGETQLPLTEQVGQTGVEQLQKVK
jgi:hypothetical protein